MRLVTAICGEIQRCWAASRQPGIVVRGELVAHAVVVAHRVEEALVALDELLDGDRRPSPRRSCCSAAGRAPWRLSTRNVSSEPKPATGLTISG
jgi:hypothetical protein